MFLDLFGEHFGNRLLIRGDGGSESRSLCKWIALSWAKEKCSGGCSSCCIHVFDAVFLLSSFIFKISKSPLAEIIKCNLYAEDSQVTRDDIERILKEGKALLLIDDYDEFIDLSHWGDVTVIARGSKDIDFVREQFTLFYDVVSRDETQKATSSQSIAGQNTGLADAVLKNAPKIENPAVAKSELQ
jgi:hypothetical protein